MYVEEVAFPNGSDCFDGMINFYVIDGSSVVAAVASSSVPFFKAPGGWIYGGNDAWYVDVPGRGVQFFSKLTPELVAAPPAKADGEVDWYCLCYAEGAPDSGREAATACRRTRAKCRSLERKVRSTAHGAAGEVTSGCVLVRAEHPGDLYGGRATWQPSSVGGAWWVPNRCVLEPTAEDGDG